MGNVLLTITPINLLYLWNAFWKTSNLSIDLLQSLILKLEAFENSGAQAGHSVGVTMWEADLGHFDSSYDLDWIIVFCLVPLEVVEIHICTSSFSKWSLYINSISVCYQASKRFGFLRRSKSHCCDLFEISIREHKLFLLSLSNGFVEEDSWLITFLCVSKESGKN